MAGKQSVKMVQCENGLCLSWSQDSPSASTFSGDQKHRKHVETDTQTHTHTQQLQLNIKSVLKCLQGKKNQRDIKNKMVLIYYTRQSWDFDHEVV